jgi:uncharacterized protein YhfF
MFQRINGMRTIEFGTPGPSREKLVNLILHGEKRATAGLLIVTTSQKVSRLNTLANCSP